MDKREEYLLSQGIRAEMIAAVNAFRATYDVDSAVAERIACPSMPFFGKETLEMAIAAILQESNLLLSGGKGRAYTAGKAPVRFDREAVP